MPKQSTPVTPLQLLLQPMLVDECKRLRLLPYNRDKRNVEIAKIAISRVLADARCTPADVLREAGLANWLPPPDSPPGG